ncbi:hypothetical protein Tco_0205099 [Tanacetum coccineum]
MKFEPLSLAYYFPKKCPEITQEVLNAAAGGIFLYKTPNQAYRLLDDKVLLKLDWAKNQKTKSSLKKTVAFTEEGSSNSDTDKVMARMDAMTMKIDAQYKELQSHTFMDLKTKLETTTKDHQASIENLEAKFERFANKQSGRPFGSLPSNTHSSKPYQPSQAQNEHVNVVFTQSGKSYDSPINPNDQHNNSGNPVNFDSDNEDEEPTPKPISQNREPVKETPIPKPYKPKFSYPQHLRKEKMEAQYGKFLYMIRAVRVNVPLVDVLARMPNYGKILKELVSNKHKLEQISSAFLSDESSAVIQNKVPLKLGDLGNFVILEMEEDSKVPLILGRPFLHTADAVIRVK